MTERKLALIEEVADKINGSNRKSRDAIATVFNWLEGQNWYLHSHDTANIINRFLINSRKEALEGDEK